MKEPDRRGAPRFQSLGDHGIVSARIRPGHPARLVDVSAGGALIETLHRLLPGRSVELQMEAQDRRTTIRGCVVRCAVVAVRAASVSYRGAVPPGAIDGQQTSARQLHPRSFDLEHQRPNVCGEAEHLKIPLA